jgi:hypothetical protein
VHAAHEGAVDLERADGEAVQVRQRRVARAEVVQLQVDPQRLQLLQHRGGRAAALHQHALVSSSFRWRASRPRVGQGAADVAYEPRVRELAGAQVDADRDARVFELPPPLRQPLARLLQHPLPQRHDDPRLLGRADEVARRDHPLLGVPPAAERLHADHPPRRQRHDGLVVEHELAAGQRAAQVGLHLQAGQGAGVHGAVEHLAARPARTPWRGTSPCPRCAAGTRPVVPRVAQRDADAGGGEHS